MWVDVDDIKKSAVCLLRLRHIRHFRVKTGLEQERHVTLQAIGM